MTNPFFTKDRDKQSRKDGKDESMLYWLLYLRRMCWRQALRVGL